MVAVNIQNGIEVQWNEDPTTWVEQAILCRGAQVEVLVPVIEVMSRIGTFVAIHRHVEPLIEDKIQLVCTEVPLQGPNVISSDGGANVSEIRVQVVCVLGFIVIAKTDGENVVACLLQHPDPQLVAPAPCLEHGHLWPNILVIVLHAHHQNVWPRHRVFLSSVCIFFAGLAIGLHEHLRLHRRHGRRPREREDDRDGTEQVGAGP